MTISNGTQMWIDDFERKLSSLQEKIAPYADHDSETEKEIRREMELLANEFGLTVWYEARRLFVDDDEYPYDDIRWDVFIPNNFQKELAEEAYFGSGLRSFMFGESEGNEQGCWISSYSC